MKADMLNISRLMMNRAQSDPNGLNKAGKGADQDQKKELAKACEEFESLFVNQLMKQMRKTIPESELLPESQAKEIYTSMLDTQLASKIAKGQGIGLAKMMISRMESMRPSKT